ncbi:Probable serine/threonine-protein kinase PBL8 [Linum perenne]
MNIAMGVAERQQYLHFQETPIIFRDMKPTNILLDKDIEPKISDFGISRAGQEGDKSHVYTSVLGTPDTSIQSTIHLNVSTLNMISTASELFFSNSSADGRLAILVSA